MKRFFPISTTKTRQGTGILLIVFLLAAGWLLAQPAAARSAPIPAGYQTGPTPAPQTAQPGNTRGVSPIVGVIVLLAPIIFIAWKSRGKKQPEITAACCLPVIDESKSPFQIVEDKQDTVPIGSQKAPKA